ncbi:MAG: beta-ACP synthase [Bacteroidia bacterium]|nr:beta-ACP synthase [Bacteroidia bacterium]
MEHHLTTYIVKESLISALGFNAEEHLRAMRNYRSGITCHAPGEVSDFPLQAATIAQEELLKRVQANGLDSYSRMEQLFILTIQELLEGTDVDPQDSACGIILSTIKGNIADLNPAESLQKGDYLWGMAEKIQHHFQFKNRIQIVSNACISGVSALVLGKRMLEYGVYKRVIVAGGDCLSHFITSGFHSFKSLSEQPCRPYDKRRDGLTLGEACGAILLSTEGNETDVILSGGAISNDANHISGPSRTGDGLYFAIRNAMHEAGTTPQEISFINAHGTATGYNDEMESKAITWAGLQEVPVQSLKPYFGHTLGASGVIESILCVRQLKEGVLFGTLGFEQLGVSLPLHISAEHQALPMKQALKTASGFGGCNAAIVLTRPEFNKRVVTPSLPPTEVIREVEVGSQQIKVDNEVVFQTTEQGFAPFIREAFKRLGESNLKFYKMDSLCKLAYITAAELLKGINFQPEEMGILLANASSSLHTDIRHQELIQKEGDAAASPTLFVYTLPNVAIGEICIRHKIQGENTFFIEPTCSWEEMERLAQMAMAKNGLTACIIGWCEQLKENYQAKFKLIITQKN